MDEKRLAVAKAVLEKIEEKRKASGKAYFVVAIDGRCGAGKTTLAADIRNLCDCQVLPMDHFFLRPEQRTKERLTCPGGNVDYERFEEEVLKVLGREEELYYRPYSCREQKLAEPIKINRTPLIVVEGSYSCHPALRSYYDMKIFLTVGKQEQLKRIERRNGQEGLSIFREKWIPLEEEYFEACKVEKICDIRINTDILQEKQIEIS